MKNILRLSPIINLEKHCLEGEIINLNVGYDGLLYILIDKKRSDYTLQVCAFSESEIVLDIEIKRERFHIYYLHPLPNDQILLVNPTAPEWWPKEFYENGRIYGKDGVFRRGIRLGDAIKDVQVTSNGVIWVGYSYYGDEVLGLAAWDLSGKQLYRFSPSDGLPYMSHCYTLNVASNDSTWFYHDSDFPLVSLQSYRVEGLWSIPISGSDAFAVSGNKVIIRGYDDRRLYSVYKLCPKSFFPIKAFEILYEGSGKKVTQRVKSRGNRFWIQRNNKIYSFTVEDALIQLAGK